MAFLAMLHGAISFACVCASPSSPEAELEAHSLVFRGTVEAIHHRAACGCRQSSDVAEFVVDEIFRGDPQLVGERLDVLVQLETSCAVQGIEPGAEYVIFTDAANPRLAACTPGLRLGVGDSYYHCADPTDEGIELLEDVSSCAGGAAWAKMSEETLLEILRDAAR